MREFENVAVIGAGVIGASWAALFLASGRNVAVYDPSPTMQADVRAYIDNAWPTLRELGLAEGEPGLLSFHDDVAGAVQHADFVQESVPERSLTRSAGPRSHRPAGARARGVSVRPIAARRLSVLSSA